VFSLIKEGTPPLKKRMLLFDIYAEGYGHGHAPVLYSYIIYPSINTALFLGLGGHGRRVSCSTENRYKCSYMINNPKERGHYG